MLLNKHNLELAKLVTAEESRYTLNSILVTPKETIATDGHQLTIVTTPAPDLDECFPMVPGFEKLAGFEFEPFLLDRQSALELAAALPKQKKNPLPILDNVAVGCAKPEDETRPFAVTDLERHRVFNVRRPAGKFPNHMAVMPDHREAKFTVALDPTLLITILTAFSRFLGGKTQTLKAVRLFFYDAESPIRIDGQNDETGQFMTSVLMPMSPSSVGAKAVRDYHPRPEPEPEAQAEPVAEATGKPVPPAETAPEPIVADPPAEATAETAEPIELAPAAQEEPAAEGVRTEVAADPVSLNGSTSGEPGEAAPAKDETAARHAAKAKRMSDYWAKRRAQAPEPQTGTSVPRQPAGNGWDNPEVRAKRIAAIKAARARIA